MLPIKVVEQSIFSANAACESPIILRYFFKFNARSVWTSAIASSPYGGCFIIS
jgi:hypothetical protein